MEDEKKTNESVNEEKEQKKTSEPKKERRTIKSIIATYKGEFDKIIWPSREDLIKQTFTVIVTSLMIGAIIASMDYVFAFCYRMLINLAG